MVACKAHPINQQTLTFPQLVDLKGNVSLFQIRNAERIRRECQDEYWKKSRQKDIARIKNRALKWPQPYREATVPALALRIQRDGWRRPAGKEQPEWPFFGVSSKCVSGTVGLSNFRFVKPFFTTVVLLSFFNFVLENLYVQVQVRKFRRKQS